MGVVGHGARLTEAIQRHSTCLPLDSGPGLPGVRRMNLSARPSDDGAGQFDSLLRESLHYRAPEALFEHIQSGHAEPNRAVA